MSAGAETRGKAVRAARTRLEPGEHSIDRVKARERDNAFVIDWSVRLLDGRIVNRRTQAASVSEARRRAKVTAAQLLNSNEGPWKPTADLKGYIEDVSRPAIERSRLRPNSKARYFAVLDLLLGKCEAHDHAFSFAGHTIASGTRFRALEACLKEIAELHGSETAHQARSVLSKYVIQELNRDEVMTGNPLKGMSIDLSGSKPKRRRGGRALTEEEYRWALDYMLEIDPSVGLIKPVQGRWTLEDLIAKRRNIVDLTLLQAATGLRVTEANSLTWGDVKSSADDTVRVTVTEDVSKTHRERTVPILDERVADRILDRQTSGVPLTDFVIGAPTDSTKKWNRDNCQKAANKLYLELAAELEIPLLTTARTHVWRATLNTLLVADVPEAIRSAYFGHDVAVNRTAYTDISDTTAMLDAARRRAQRRADEEEADDSGEGS
ncbi:site-specific integrase [Frondihabitans australicus]|uniref:Phage integrase family protein n=1 Tax=Frondihabitans australicus TaxID=386892 RepID=A0A495IFG6_9MICO|nr:site-specific integrase [Frondihabitans australicus]RKR74753.1 phage integrase family protein [Frondihabitans australicus]